MVEAFFSNILIERFKIIISSILVYVLIYAILVKLKPFGDTSKVNALVALLFAILVSFSGVVTYSISYAINWFIIILFIIFLVIVLLLFLGVKPQQISNSISGKNLMYVFGAFALLFLIILIKSFFALNNSIDTQNSQIDNYNVNTSYNDGFLNDANNSTSFFDRIDMNLVYMSLFFIGIGVFIIFVG